MNFAKFKTFLPIILFGTFNRTKLKETMRELYERSAMNISHLQTVDYDKYWTFGFELSGSMVYDYIWIWNKLRKPTKNEMVEVIRALPYEYKYNKNTFTEHLPNVLSAVLEQ